LTDSKHNQAVLSRKQSSEASPKPGQNRIVSKANSAISKIRFDEGILLDGRNTRNVSGFSIRLKFSPAASRRKKHGRGYGSSHGLKIATPRPSKCLTLRVTTVRSCSRAVAAISPSAVLSGLPFD